MKTKKSSSSQVIEIDFIFLRKISNRLSSARVIPKVD